MKLTEEDLEKYYEASQHVILPFLLFLLFSCSSEKAKHTPISKNKIAEQLQSFDIQLTDDFKFVENKTTSTSQFTKIIISDADKVQVCNSIKNPNNFVYIENDYRIRSFYVNSKNFTEIFVMDNELYYLTNDEENKSRKIDLFSYKIHLNDNDYQVLKYHEDIWGGFGMSYENITLLKLTQNGKEKILPRFQSDTNEERISTSLQGKAAFNKFVFDKRNNTLLIFESNDLTYN